MHELLDLTEYLQAHLIRDMIEERLNDLREHLANPDRPAKILDQMAYREVTELEILMQRINYILEK